MALLRQENSESDVSVDLGSRREHELRSDGDVPRLFLLEHLNYCKVLHPFPVL